MVVDGGRLDPSSPRSSGAGPYLPVEKFRRLFEKFRGPVHDLPNSWKGASPRLHQGDLTHLRSNVFFMYFPKKTPFLCNFGSWSQKGDLFVFVFVHWFYRISRIVYGNFVFTKSYVLSRSPAFRSHPYKLLQRTWYSTAHTAHVVLCRAAPWWPQN